MSLHSDAIRYEEIIKALYQALMLNDGYDNVNVQHNITLKGKSGATSQFDIFWEFKIAGIRHRVAIECKNYNRSVGVDDVREFACKLQDVGNLIGIMVTRKGYQEGAIKTAKASGIYLKKFQLPVDMNWDGRIRKVIITIHTLTSENIKRRFILDSQWLSQFIQERGKDTAQKILTDKVGAPSNEYYLINNHREVLKTLRDLDNEIPRDKAAIGQKHSFSMDGGAFLFVPSHPEYPEMKLSSIEYEYDVIDTVEEISISADAVLQGLLSDVDGQESLLFFLDNTILKCK